MGRYGGPPRGTSGCGRVGEGALMYKYVSAVNSVWNEGVLHHLRPALSL